MAVFTNITITMSRLFKKFSSKENLKKAYFYIQNELAHSSLSVSPINHPATTAINDLGEHFFVALEQHLRDGNYRPEKGFFIYMPKDNLSVRPICILSMVDRIVYQAIFNPDILGYKIDGQLSDKLCFANRVNDDEETGHFLSQYFNGWDDFCKEQKKAFDKEYSWKIEVDVQQYYEHIPVGRLISKLQDLGIKDERILTILKEQICAWAEYPELPKGIPQGPEASAVLGNAYLSSLDAYAEKTFIGKKLRYFRYADDITLMGKTKEDVLKATDKIVRFLREHNLTLNEKTRLTELENAEAIETMRFCSHYEEDTAEIPEDEFARIQNNVPFTIASILNGERIDVKDIRELKYFLKVGTGCSLDLIKSLIEVIPFRPSLTVPIIRYVSEGREFLSTFGDLLDTMLIDDALWGTHKRTDISEWCRFWILKLLASNKDTFADGFKKRVEKILSLRENTTSKIVCFYYKAIQKEEINIDQVRLAIDESNTNVEKSLYSFFLLNAFQGVRTHTIKNHIEQLLNNKSHELNLIGAYLFKNKPKAIIDDFDGIFSGYLLKKKTHNKKRKNKNPLNAPQQDFFLVRSESLIPISSPTSILGVNRPQKKKHCIELIFPEIVQWEKVLLKMKEGLQDLEIHYDGKHIKTASYIELGFSANKKEHKPDRKWNFLCILSVLQNEDITQATPNNITPMLAKFTDRTMKRANIHQTKKLLSKELRVVFKTDDNPFTDNRVYYEPKFKILPESTLRNKEVRKLGGKLNENFDYDEIDN